MALQVVCSKSVSPPFFIPPADNLHDRLLVHSTSQANAGVSVADDLSALLCQEVLEPIKDFKFSSSSSLCSRRSHEEKMSLSKGEPSVTCLGKIKSHLLQEALSSVQISVEVAPPAAVTDLRTEPPSSEAHCMVRAIEKTGGEEVFHRKTLSESEIFYTRLQSSHEAGDSTNAAAATSPEGSPSSPGSPAPPEADASASSCPGAPIKRRMDDGSRLAAIADVVKFRKAVRELNFGFNFNGLEVLRSSCDVAPIARMATSHEGSHPSPARPHPSPAGSHPAPPGLHDSPPASAAAPEAATTAKVYPPGAPKKRRPGDRLDLAATMSKTKKCRIVSRKLNFDAASSRILLM